MSKSNDIEHKKSILSNLFALKKAHQKSQKRREFNCNYNSLIKTL